MKNIAEQNEAELQILEEKEPVSFDTREYPVEVLIDKYSADEFFIPTYQRNFVWEEDKEKMSKFIESVILDLPIPYLFFADDGETGKLEIVDGSQRIRTLNSFKNDEFELEGLEKLDLLNGFRFSDLPESRRRRFLRKTLRSIELTEKASSDVRRDLFARINTKPYDLSPMEIRKGLYDGDFYNFIDRCSNDELFVKLCPLSEKTRNRGDAQELVLRYFAYADNYQNFIHSVEDFMDDYMKDKHNSFDENAMKIQFDTMLQFVDNNFPYGFRKGENYNTVAKVRFEAISIGVTLALREREGLDTQNISTWLSSKEFKEQTTSGSANNRNKVVGRIEFVKNKLLRQ
ncbi:hypothetical protein EZS27_010506 [termite gut metagenome]|uniref:GmrSD restriction endonucleases N-terminal domain-containing protein n=1 Tax=termite gut metagenome TaxID=433724 RepID=A0A5J4S6K5_9ZZZZ